MSEQASENPAAKKKPKWLIMGAAALVVVALGLGGAWKAGLFAHKAGHEAPKLAVAPALLEIPDIVTNLDTGSQRTRFIKLHARLVLPSPDDRIAAEKLVPQVTDTIQTYLRAVTADDLRGAEGTYRLRTALLNRISVTIAPAHITDVLFSELLVQ